MKTAEEKIKLQYINHLKKLMSGKTQKENDEIIKDNDVTYLIEKKLYEMTKPINIDFIESSMGSGFSITSAISKGSSCGSCSC